MVYSAYRSLADDGDALELSSYEFYEDFVCNTSGRTLMRLERPSVSGRLTTVGLFNVDFVDAATGATLLRVQRHSTHSWSRDVFEATTNTRLGSIYRREGDAVTPYVIHDPNDRVLAGCVHEPRATVAVEAPKGIRDTLLHWYGSAPELFSDYRIEVDGASVARVVHDHGGALWPRRLGIDRTRDVIDIRLLLAAAYCWR